MIKFANTEIKLVGMALAAIIGIGSNIVLPKDLDLVEGEEKVV